MSSIVNGKSHEPFIRAEREDYEAMLRGEPFFTESVNIGHLRVGESADIRKTIRVRETVGGTYTGRWTIVSLDARIISTGTLRVVVSYRVATAKLSGRLQMVPGLKRNPGLEIIARNEPHGDFRLGRIGGDDAKDEQNSIGIALCDRDTPEADRQGNTAVVPG